MKARVPALLALALALASAFPARAQQTEGPERSLAAARSLAAEGRAASAARAYDGLLERFDDGLLAGRPGVLPPQPRFERRGLLQSAVFDAARSHERALAFEGASERYARCAREPAFSSAYGSERLAARCLRAAATLRARQGRHEEARALWLELARASIDAEERVLARGAALEEALLGPAAQALEALREAEGTRLEYDSYALVLRARLGLAEALDKGGSAVEARRARAEAVALARDTRFGAPPGAAEWIAQALLPGLRERGRALLSRSLAPEPRGRMPQRARALREELEGFEADAARVLALPPGAYSGELLTLASQLRAHVASQLEGALDARPTEGELPPELAPLASAARELRVEALRAAGLAYRVGAARGQELPWVHLAAGALAAAERPELELAARSLDATLLRVLALPVDAEALLRSLPGALSVAGAERVSSSLAAP